MAHELWLLRHGDAEPHGTRPDAERRLTELGEREAQAAGAALRELHVEPTAVFTSPRVRALQTAKLACASLGIEPVVHEPLSAGFTAQEALTLCAGLDVVLIVGHQPDFGQIVHDLTGARPELATGGVAGVRLDDGGTLLTLLRPRALRLIGGV
jgi:phosphohistidine phosphatase